MNYDRFLTRVWDKEEKKMLYQNSKFIYDGILYEFETVTDFGIVASAFISKLGLCQFVNLEFDDRFIPMACTGLSDKNDKLIYGRDLLADLSEDKINFSSYEVFLNDIGFEMGRPLYHGNLCGGYIPQLTPETTSKMEIIGNKFENLELLKEAGDENT